MDLNEWLKGASEGKCVFHPTIFRRVLLIYLPIVLGNLHVLTTTESRQLCAHEMILAIFSLFLFCGLI